MPIFKCRLRTPPMIPLTIRIYSHRVINSTAILDSRLLQYFVVIRPDRLNGLRDRMPQLGNDMVHSRTHTSAQDGEFCGSCAGASSALNFIAHFLCLSAWAFRYFCMSSFCSCPGALS